MVIRNRWVTRKLSTLLVLCLMSQLLNGRYGSGMLRLSYDAAGRLASVANPLSQATSYLYNLRGDLVSVTDADGHTTLSGYDALGRRTGKTWPDGSLEGWTYDANGNVLSHQLRDGHTNTTSYDL